MMEAKAASKVNKEKAIEAKAFVQESLDAYCDWVGVGLLSLRARPASKCRRSVAQILAARFL